MVSAFSTRKIDLGSFVITEIEPGIFENFIKPGAHVGTEDAWELKRQNMELSGGLPYCVLVVSGHLSSVSKEAREIVASKEYVGVTKAKAFLIESLGHRIVGNFYLTVNKPHIKTKLFSNRNDAILWLRQQLAA